MVIKPVVKAELEQFLYFLAKALSNSSCAMFWIWARDSFKDLQSTLESVDCQNQINGFVKNNM